MSPELSFALPPSMGHMLAEASAAQLRSLLDDLVGDLCRPDVYVADSYPALSIDLLHGRADLAWGPPSLCARAEVHGARVLVQARRAGSSSYRSVLLAQEGFSFAAADAPSLRAAWVDADSTGGYLLACAWLKEQGVDPRRGLARQRFYGSYRAAVDAVLDGEAELTAVFATAEDASEQRTALDDLPGDLKDRLTLVAYTRPTPNDGLAARPGFDPALAQALAARFVAATDREELRPSIDAVFRADGFSDPGDDAYRALHDLVMSV